MSHTEVSSTAVFSEGESHNSISPGGTKIAGYEMLERIGVGGFGEVWRAIGPGGFSKAVKILFGNLSGPQADTELKSLNRIRDLRHPFLLSIERVEVVDGRVIVVTELADRSLDQRFRELVSAGQHGLSRDELLGYLRDTADALDFMSEEHGLQHLDIKPENILLQGAHAKVGDFGLTKAVGQTRHSLVNGFTPLYAPPELFEGRPDRGSDQYSLAIVYQTMLTGIPPFNGRTASQLMAQHLKSSPDLSRLLPSDRAVVARALSKNPRTRFAGCRQFVDELMKRRPTKSLSNRATSGSAAEIHQSRTSVASTENITSNHSMLHGKATPLAPVQSLPEDTQYKPTLFVGIGGLGCQSVELLNQRIHQLFPDASVPAIQLLCIDTDNDAILNLKRSHSKSTRTTTTIAAPLRTTQEYRKESSEHLTWLSRRWLFNIPRSGRVEGMRPLGRLAIVDHAADIQTELKNCLTALVSSASLKTSVSETGLPFDTTGIDVCIVGSTSGGTSSGCMMDIAWMIRELVSNGRMPPVRVSSMLLHGTAHGRQVADMQDANTVSFLQELQHFSVPGAQRPGLISRFSDSDISKPFDETTLVHFGDDLSPIDFLEGVNRTAEYLELRTLTPARREMNAWRNPERTNIPESLESHLRSFGLSSINAESWEVAHREAGQLASAAVRRWSQPSKSDAEPDEPEWTALLDQLGLSSEAVQHVIPGLLDAGRSRRMEDYANSVWQRLSRESAGSPQEQVAGIISEDTAARSDSRKSIVNLTEEVQAELAARLPQNLQLIESFLKEILDTKMRPGLAVQALTALIRHTDQALAACRSQKNDLQGAFNDLCASHSVSTLDQSTAAAHTAMRGFCRQYCMLFTCRAVCQSFIEHQQAMMATLPKFLEELCSNPRANDRGF
jgi:eukaryotic-like serine/threonine-protein kinase